MKACNRFSIIFLLPVTPDMEAQSTLIGVKWLTVFTATLKKYSFSRCLLHTLNCLPAVADSNLDSFWFSCACFNKCPLQSKEMEKHRNSLWNANLHIMPFWCMTICFLWRSSAILHLLAVPHSCGNGQPILSPCKSGTIDCVSFVFTEQQPI